MIKQTRRTNLTKNFKEESLLSSHVPYACFVNEHTIETKNGNLLQIIKLNGLFAETLDEDLLDAEKNKRNALWMSLTDSSTLFYFHTIRRKIDVQLNGEYKNDFCKKLHQKWQDHLQTQEFFVNEHYITVVKKPPVGKIRKLSDCIKSLSGALDKEARAQFREESLQNLNKITKTILANLANYQPKRLENDAIPSLLSDSLSFLAHLLNLETRPIIAPRTDLADTLCYKRLFFDTISGTIAMRDNKLETCYAAILSIKNYTDISYAGMLDPLLQVKAELILTQSFNPIEKASIRSKIKEEKRNSEQSDDGETSASDHILTALDEMGSGKSATGNSHFSLLCHASSKAALEEKVAEMEAVFNQIGLIAIREDTGLKAAYFAQLPGNQTLITREACLSSKNIASFASFHNTSNGTPVNNYWGESVTVLETMNGAPFHFNFHVSDVGNTFMIGSMSSGKTLLQAFLLSESMKFGGQLIVFDKDRSLEIFIRAIGGSYACLTPSKGTGFAPFQMDDTPDNRYFLSQLLRKIATYNGYRLNSHDDEMIKCAIDGAYQLPKGERILRNVVAFLGMQKAGSLRASFTQWVNDGDYAWVFDHDVDALSLEQTALGYDMSAILEDDTIAHVVYFYLFNRIEKLLDGRRIRILAAESWRALQNEAFRAKIQEWSSTPRKKNAFLILDTQAPSDIAKSEIACKIIQETATQIYFANHKASYEDYVGQFKLTKKEFQIIKNIDKESRFFLLKQGRNSVVVRAKLPEQFANEIAVLSGRSLNLKVFDRILNEIGHEVCDWLPAFYEAVNQQGVCV